jgi:mono/diheme cytochrome c family protein
MTVRAPTIMRAGSANPCPRRIAIPAVAIALAALATASSAAPGDVARGQQLYMATGCYQCHGTRGEGGGNAGPRLAPMPIPLEALKLQLRRPRGRMPLYTAVVMPDGDVADIYAYLLSVPKGKAAAEIPMLKALPTGGGSK